MKFSDEVKQRIYADEEMSKVPIKYFAICMCRIEEILGECDDDEFFENGHENRTQNEH